MKLHKLSKTSGVWLAGTLAVMPILGWSVHAATEPSESQCQLLSDDYGGSASDVPLAKSCCRQVFKSAHPSARLDFILGNVKYSVAGRGRAVCIDQFQVDLTGKTPAKFLKRNMIAGRNTKLKSIDAISGAGKSIFVSGEEKGSLQILAFDYTMDGNIFPSREMKPASAPASVSLSADDESNQLLLLGQDGKIRYMDSRYYDLSLKPEEHSRIDGVLESSVQLAAPVAIARSNRLGRIFVLTDDRKVSIFIKGRAGKAAPESSFDVEDVSKPVKIAVQESVASDKVILQIDGADGTRVNVTYDLKAAGK